MCLRPSPEARLHTPKRLPYPHFILWCRSGVHFCKTHPKPPPDNENEKCVLLMTVNMLLWPDVFKHILCLTKIKQKHSNRNLALNTRQTYISHVRVRTRSSNLCCGLTFFCEHLTHARKICCNLLENTHKTITIAYRHAPHVPQKRH